MQDRVRLALSPCLQKRVSFSKNREVLKCSFILNFMKKLRKLFNVIHEKTLITENYSRSLVAIMLRGNQEKVLQKFFRMRSNMMVS